MKQKIKIIKLSDTHYVGANNSEIKKGDISVVRDGGVWKINYHPLNNEYNKRILYSTEPLVIEWEGKTHLHMNNFDSNIKPLSLSEIEEALYGYSVESLTKKYVYNRWKNADNQTAFNSTSCEKDYLAGFNKCKELLVKDKFFSVEDMYGLLDVCKDNVTNNLNSIELAGRSYIQSLLPKTEWDCKIDEDGKITLIK